MTIKQKIGLGLFAFFIMIQFIQPKKNQGAYNLKSFFEETGTDEKTQTLLLNACVDCHSNESKYPWYSRITPVNFWMAHHVEEGKEHLNLSDWASLSNKKKAHKLEEIYEEVEEKEMPLTSYTWTHKEAKLTKEQVKLIVNWAKKAKEKFE